MPAVTQADGPVAVTGASGYIGTHTVIALMKRGYAVRACITDPDNPDKTEPGDCGCGTPETDSDADGVPDCNDGCPNDPDKTEPGDCGCGTPETDSDADGVPDCIDGCPNDPNKSEPGDCGCGTPDDDSDADGVCNSDDVCAIGDDTEDRDGDLVPDACDICPDSAPDDADGDGVCGDVDLCQGDDASGDPDGDGKKEMIAAAYSSGLWLLEPGRDPRGEWSIESIDRDSSGFEHASIFADLDGDGTDELYVAADRQGEIRRYVWQNGRAAREVIHIRAVARSMMTWNIMPVPVSLLGG